MKRKKVSRLLAASLATAMTVSMVGCGNSDAPASSTTSDDSSSADQETPAADTADTSEGEASSEAEGETEEAADDGYEVLTDADGNVYDLGGMEIIIRDWWSPADGSVAEPKDDFEEAQQEYREWAQETYNFTLKQMAISDWASTPQDFVEYATAGGDENYAWVLREDPATSSAMASGLMYDLSTLDCLDFSDSKFSNKVHEKFGKGTAIYCMSSGKPEPRTGIFFNKRILTDAGIDPEEIYDLQASGDWTWDKFEEYLSIVQRDIDNDGVIDIAGFNENNGVVQMAVFSNNGAFIGKDSSGMFTYALEDPNTLEALEWAAKIINDYRQVPPEDAQWDYYKQAFVNGEIAFMPEDAYCMYYNSEDNKGFLCDMEDDFGFVMFPKGPQASDYVNVWSDNPVAIPSCYDADKAWKIAFAWNVWTENPPGYEDYVNYAHVYAGARDTRAVDETFAMMTEKGVISYQGVIPSLDFGPDFIWGFGKGVVVSEAVEGIRDTWKSYVDAANQ